MEEPETCSPKKKEMISKGFVSEWTKVLTKFMSTNQRNGEDTLSLVQSPTFFNHICRMRYEPNLYDGLVVEAGNLT